MLRRKIHDLVFLQLFAAEKTPQAARRLPRHSDRSSFALSERGLAPHIYESAEEAHHHLREFAPGGATDAARLRSA
jgi:hypothetical protein